MPRITVGQENGQDVILHFDDHGSGRPVVMIHGYPLDGRSWEKQEQMLLDAGNRVITYDRRGFGKSTQPSTGYDYDTFAADLKVLLDELDLDDVVLVGFSMGTGEVTRYLGRYGSARVSKAVLLGAIPPFLLKTADNPEGVDGAVFDGIKKSTLDDRPAALKTFVDNLLNFDVYRGTRASDQAWQAEFNSALVMSPLAAYASVDTWLTDFREDVGRIDVPTLLMHGDADRILPYQSTAARLPALMKDLTFITVEGGPHNIGWTHHEVVNPALLDFVRS